MDYETDDECALKKAIKKPFAVITFCDDNTFLKFFTKLPATSINFSKRTINCKCLIWSHSSDYTFYFLQCYNFRQTIIKQKFKAVIFVRPTWNMTSRDLSHFRYHEPLTSNQIRLIWSGVSTNKLFLVAAALVRTYDKQYENWSVCLDETRNFRKTGEIRFCLSFRATQEISIRDYHTPVINPKPTM